MSNTETLQNVYVVNEGNAYNLLSDEIPSHLNQDNWLCDWTFIGAENEVSAIKTAKLVDDRCNKCEGRVYVKFLNIKNIQQNLLESDLLTPWDIYQTQGNSVNSKRLQFNQKWVGPLD